MKRQRHSKNNLVFRGEEMKTPIYDFVEKYVQGGAVRAHMPAHKGKTMLGCESRDITEIDGADVLYHADGIIRDSESIVSRLFKTARTCYSTEGSSLSIRAMLYLALVYARAEGKRARILAARNAHKALLCACALLGIDIEWIYPSISEGIVSCDVSALEIKELLLQTDVCAVYITSPDYLGNIADIEGISRVCRERSVLLLVDNAHGAYLNFLPESRHPIALGADICTDSAHKTLPVLTGGGYLHISEKAPSICIDSADCAMALFASTSPSYLILQSLDLANKYISDGYRESVRALIQRLDETRERLKRAGYTLVGDEPVKLTILAKRRGYTGYELAGVLRDGGVECEFADPDHLVLMLSVENTDDDILRIERVLDSCSPREPILNTPPSVCRAERVISPREAMLSPSREVNVCDALGMVLAQPSVSCPPAVPVLVCGERIDERALRAFEYYGIDKCRVIEK